MTQTTRALAYYRKNYLFGVARPGALVIDDGSLTCLSNDLSVVFSIPAGLLRIKEGFGIFKIYSGDQRVSVVTPVGATTSPRPSDQLSQFLTGEIGMPGRTTGAGAVAGGVMLGNALGGAFGAAGAAGGVVGEAAMIKRYVSGQRELRAWLEQVAHTS